MELEDLCGGSSHKELYCVLLKHFLCLSVRSKFSLSAPVKKFPWVDNYR